MITAEIAQEAENIFRRAPRSSWDQICVTLGSAGRNEKVSAMPFQSFPALGGNLHSSLMRLLRFAAELHANELCSSLRTVQHLAESELLANEPTIAWTGPENGLFPVRRADQILYDLISQASNRVLIVTFAAVKIQHLVKHLESAINRGIQVTLILESKEESEGQLSFDAANAFSPAILSNAEVLVWPLEKRKRNSAGNPGKLHVKCAVVDDQAIISSANLTEDAFNRNMELGLVIEQGKLPQQIYSHFSALKQKGELMPASF